MNMIICLIMNNARTPALPNTSSSVLTVLFLISGLEQSDPLSLVQIPPDPLLSLVDRHWIPY